MKKENFKVREIHDREGHTEQVIMEESEIIAAVEKCEKENSVQELLKKEGIFRNGQSFGTRVSLEIDTRSGKIITCTTPQNQSSPVDPFFIELVGFTAHDFEDSLMCNGDDMVVEVTEQFIIENTDIIIDAEDIENYLETEKLDSGKYKISWWDNQDYIDCEDFINNWMDEDYEEWVEDYENYLLEDVYINLNAITEYYQQLRDIREY